MLFGKWPLLSGSQTTFKRSPYIFFICGEEQMINKYCKKYLNEASYGPRWERESKSCHVKSILDIYLVFLGMYIAFPKNL